MAKTLNVTGYNLSYTGEKSVSPFSSTIVSTAVYSTADTTACTKLCDGNSFCGAVELFVERVPESNPDPSKPNPAPIYQFVCRLHNKALSNEDAKHVGRFYQAFYRTQTQVVFQNRKGWKKSYGTTLDKACKDDAACGKGFSCEASSKKCKLAVGQPCSSSFDDTKCSTGLCSSSGPSAPTQCIAKNKNTVPRDKHCLTSADCDSKNCIASTKVCGAKALNAECYSPTECESQYCVFGTSGGSRPVGKCGATLLRDGLTCTRSEACYSGYCNGASRCAPLDRQIGTACDADKECASGRCDLTASPKVCAVALKADGSVCQADSECSSAYCRTNSDQSKTCAKKNLANGAACSGSDVCSSGYCGPGSKCAALNRAPGSECADNKECSSGKCNTQASPKVCTASLYAACKTDQECASAFCLFGQSCFPFRLTTGSACLTDNDCLHGDCNSNFECAAPLSEVGVTCSADTDCKSGKCKLAGFPASASRRTRLRARKMPNATLGTAGRTQTRPRHALPDIWTTVNRASATMFVPAITAMPPSTAPRPAVPIWPSATSTGSANPISASSIDRPPSAWSEPD